MDRDLPEVIDMLLGIGIAGIEQLDVRLDDLLAFMGEGRGDLLVAELDAAIVDAADHAEYEHVLAAAGVADDLQALDLHRHLLDDQAMLGELLDRRGVLIADLLRRVGGPLVLQQHDGAALVSTVGDAGVQHLLVEGHHQLGLVAHVGDILGADPDAVAGAAGRRTRRGLDLGRDDLHGPDAVTHLAADLAEGLAALLRALAGVADDLDDTLVDLFRATVGEIDDFTRLFSLCGHIASLQ